MYLHDRHKLRLFLPIYLIQDLTKKRKEKVDNDYYGGNVLHATTDRSENLASSQRAQVI